MKFGVTWMLRMNKSPIFRFYEYGSDKIFILTDSTEIPNLEHIGRFIYPRPQYLDLIYSDPIDKANFF